MIPNKTELTLYNPKFSFGDVLSQEEENQQEEKMTETPQKKKIIILDRGGYLGTVISKHFLNIGFDVTITVENKRYPNWFPASKPVLVVKFDSEKDELPDLSSYDFIVNCLDINDYGYEGELLADPEFQRRYYKINSILPHKIALAKSPKSKFFQISSMGVFEKTEFTRSLTNKPDATSLYGLSKALGEIPEAIVIRANFVTGVEHGQNADGYISGITPLFLAQFIEGFCDYTEHPEKDLKVHIASKPIHRDDFKLVLNKLFPGYSVTFKVINCLLQPRGEAYAPSLEEQLTNYKQWCVENLPQ